VEQFGVAVGILLLVLVTAVAVAIVRRAAASIAAFRGEHHRRFTGREER
jgi:hypothetical protein